MDNSQEGGVHPTCMPAPAAASIILPPKQRYQQSHKRSVEQAIQATTDTSNPQANRHEAEEEEEEESYWTTKQTTAPKQLKLSTSKIQGVANPRCAAILSIIILSYCVLRNSVRQGFLQPCFHATVSKEAVRDSLQEAPYRPRISGQHS